MMVVSGREQCCESGGKDSVAGGVLECLAMWGTRDSEGCLSGPVYACQ